MKHRLMKKKKKNLQPCKIQQAGNSSGKRSHNRHRIHLTEKHQIPITPTLHLKSHQQQLNLKIKPLSYQFQKKRRFFAFF